MGRTGCSTDSESPRSHTLFPPNERIRVGRRCVFMRSPQLERRNPQPLGPLPQNPRPAKSHGPLTGRPGPQVAEGAPPSSTIGSTPAQPKLVCLALMGSARLERRGGDRGSERCLWRGCPEETRESSIWEGRSRLVTLGHSSQVASKPCCCPLSPLHSVAGGFPQVG